MKALTLRKAAERIGVHHTTLRRWIQDGEGPKALVKTGRRSTYRITAGELERFVERNSKGGK